MIRNSDTAWQEALSLHSDCAGSFAHAARALPKEAWPVPLAAEKWSPAQVVEHLTKVYKVLLSELDGGTGMRVLTNLPLQWFLGWTMVRKILRGNYFPQGARSPRETRPVAIENDPGDALDLFHALANRFHEKIQQAHLQNPNKTLTHAYFGRMNMIDMVLLCARHIQHHHRQLATLEL
jgi:hypothetical protein